MGPAEPPGDRRGARPRSGRQRHLLHDRPEGERTRGWWRVTAAEPPRALEFTDGFADADGAPNADLPTTTVRVRLAERDGTTRMELRFTFASGEHMAMLERWGAFDVFPQSVAQMDAIVAGSA